MWPADNSNEKGDVLSSSGGTKKEEGEEIKRALRFFFSIQEGS